MFTKRTWFVWMLFAVFIPTSSAAEEVLDEGVAARVPWSGYWWPFCRGGLTGPLRLYDQLTGSRSVEWEEREGRADPSAPSWHGYCHGQVAAAIMEPEAARPLVLRTRRLLEGLEITVGSQKGWLTACHTADVAEFHGDRFGDEEGTEDPQDLRPDQLWHLLQLYVRDRGVPVAVDVEPGPEVWNYPVFRYQVVSRREGQPGLWHARLTLWMADTAVSADFGGTQIRKHTYWFTFRMENGAIVMGCGQWVGPSRSDHPDFLWYPYIVKPENPEVNYRLVKQLLGHEAVGQPSRASEGSGAGSERLRPRVSTPSETSPSGKPEGTLPSSAGGKPPASRKPREDRGGSPGEFVAPPEDVQEVLSPLEFLALVTARQSSFKFDISVDRFDGAEYGPGEEYKVVGATAEPGYLYLFLIDPQGEVTLLSPEGRTAFYVTRQIELPGPQDAFTFRAPSQPGLYRVKGIITSRPVHIVGLPAEVSGKKAPSSREQASTGAVVEKGQVLMWHPAGRKVMREVLSRYLRGEETPGQIEGVKPEEVIGRFAQDEVAFYVGITAR